MRFAAATKKSLSDSWIFRLRGAAASQKQSNPIKSEKILKKRTDKNVGSRTFVYNKKYCLCKSSSEKNKNITITTSSTRDFKQQICRTPQENFNERRKGGRDGGSTEAATNRKGNKNRNSSNGKTNNNQLF